MSSRYCDACHGLAHRGGERCSARVYPTVTVTCARCGHDYGHLTDAQLEGAIAYHQLLHERYRSLTSTHDMDGL